MSLIDVFGKIVGVVGKVFGIAGSIIKIAKPLVEALRPAVDEVDTAMSWLEENAAKVGVEADDFLDRNLPAINAIEEVAGRGVVVFSGLEELTVLCRQYSQEQTPDTVTEAEAAALVAKIQMVREELAAWKPALAKAETLINSAG